MAINLQKVDLFNNYRYNKSYIILNLIKKKQVLLSLVGHLGSLTGLVEFVLKTIGTNAKITKFFALSQMTHSSVLICTSCLDQLSENR